MALTRTSPAVLSSCKANGTVMNAPIRPTTMAQRSSSTCLPQISYLLGLVFLAAASTFGQNRIPQFKDYPAVGKYAGKNAPVIITADDRRFRTRLREAAQEKPNFAGHYIITAWGCGTGCLMGAVIDANTGKVRWFPHSICCWGEIERDDNFTPIVFRLDSRLIVFTGLRNERDRDQGAHFYEFGKTGFKYIRTIR